MQKIITFVFVLMALVIFCTQGALYAKSLRQLPKSVLAQVKRDVLRDRYCVSAAPGESEAINEAQRFKVTFKDDGVTISPRHGKEQKWSFAMEVLGLGREGQSQFPLAAPSLHTEGNRVELRRGKVTEWYVNDERGLEQGFTLDEHLCPYNGKPLCVSLGVKGDLTPELIEKSNTILLRDSTGNVALRYGGLKCWDASGAHVPSTMQLITDDSDGSVSHITLLVDDAKANYPLTIDPLVFAVQRDKLLADDGATADYFGCSVAISGDYAIVGANVDDDNGSSSGSAYVFHYNGTSWSQQAKLVASDGAEDDRFGSSVAISGDFAIVGAILDDDNGNNSGSAYVFIRSGISWGEVAKLVASDGAAEDYFGSSVAISGNYAIVGARYDDAKRGSAYVFLFDGTSWSQQAKLTADDGVANDHFGGSVAISGDYAIVGSYWDDDNGSNSGSAYVFHFDGTSWSQQAKLVAGDGAEGDRFGGSVAISGDSAIVGAHFDDDNGSDSGSAYIFGRTGVFWVQQAKILPDDGATGALFGCSVAISGDYAIVGGEGDDDNGTYSGSAYLFYRNGFLWAQEDKLTADDGATADFFGNSVAISGGYAIVGAYGDDDKGSFSGSAHVYSITPNAPPVANDDSVSVNEDTATNIAVEANDTDANGESLTVSVADSLSTSGAAVSINADGVSVDYDPAGSATLQSLAQGETSNDTFEYTISDGAGETDRATVTVTVTGVNDGPSANDDFNSTNEGVLLAVAANGVLANDSDPDATDTFMVTSYDTTSACGATVTVAADGSFTYDPRTSLLMSAIAEGEAPKDSFDYTITDGFGATDTATVTITVNGVNDVPSNVSLSSPNVQEFLNVGTVVGLLGTIDGDLADGHTYSLVAGAGDEDNDKFTIVGDELRTAVILDRGANTTLSVRIAADDGNGGIFARSFIINVVAQIIVPYTDAGPDQLVRPDSEVTLFGSHSRARTGNIVSYFWEQLTGPLVTLSDATTAEPTFTAPSTIDTLLEFRLTVTDDSTNSSQDICYVNVATGGSAPFADGGGDQSVGNSTTTTLDGSASTGATTVVAYNWQQTAGMAVTLSNGTTDCPELQTPIALNSGLSLVYELTITDDRGLMCSDSCVVNVTTTNSAPSALAGNDSETNPGQKVVLNGSASTDIDGPTLTYQWKQLLGIPVRLNDTTIATPEFTAPDIDPFSTPLVFELLVEDVSGLKSRDEVQVTVVASVPGPAITGGGGGGGGGCHVGEPSTSVFGWFFSLFPLGIILLPKVRRFRAFLMAAALFRGRPSPLV